MAYETSRSDQIMKASSGLRAPTDLDRMASPASSRTVLIVAIDPISLLICAAEPAANSSGGMVFPGGGLDPEDSDPIVLPVRGIETQPRAPRSGRPRWLAFVAVVRATFEEAGPLRSPRPVTYPAAALADGWRRKGRGVVHECCCATTSSSIQPNGAHRLGHTVGPPRRYDTFFSCVHAWGQEATSDHTESEISNGYYRPGPRAWRRCEYVMVHPTGVTPPRSVPARRRQLALRGKIWCPAKAS